MSGDRESVTSSQLPSPLPRALGSLRWLPRAAGRCARRAEDRWCWPDAGRRRAAPTPPARAPAAAGAGARGRSGCRRRATVAAASGEVFVLMDKTFADIGAQAATDVYNQSPVGGKKITVEDGAAGWDAKVLPQVRDKNVRWSGVGYVPFFDQYKLLKAGLFTPLDDLLKTSKVPWASEAEGRLLRPAHPRLAAPGRQAVLHPDEAERPRRRLAHRLLAGRRLQHHAQNLGRSRQDAAQDQGSQRGCHPVCHSARPVPGARDRVLDLHRQAVRRTGHVPPRHPRVERPDDDVQVVDRRPASPGSRPTTTRSTPGRRASTRFRSARTRGFASAARCGAKTRSPAVFRRRPTPARRRARGRTSTAPASSPARQIRRRPSIGCSRSTGRRARRPRPGGRAC